MKACCETEAKKNVKKHRDTAICDRCGRLLLGYGAKDDFEKTKRELEAHGVPFEAGEVGKLFVIAKDRRK